MRGPATRSAFWGCRACKAARDEATKEVREARRRIGERRDWDDWTREDSEPPQASLAHILSGNCAGNKEEAHLFMRKLDKHTARATARVEREVPDSKDTATFLRRARAASLKAMGPDGRRLRWRWQRWQRRRFNGLTARLVPRACAALPITVVGAPVDVPA